MFPDIKVLRLCLFLTQVLEKQNNSYTVTFSCLNHCVAVGWRLWNSCQFLKNKARPLKSKLQGIKLLWKENIDRYSWATSDVHNIAPERIK